MTLGDRPPSVRDDLERHRLQLRARQLERVLLILHTRRRAADCAGVERRWLRAIGAFGAELEDVRARLLAGPARREPRVRRSPRAPLAQRPRQPRRS
jgi:hypothetical protein